MTLPWDGRMPHPSIPERFFFPTEGEPFFDAMLSATELPAINHLFHLGKQKQGLRQIRLSKKHNTAPSHTFFCNFAESVAPLATAHIEVV